MSPVLDLAQAIQMAVKALLMYTDAHPRSQEALQALGTEVNAWLSDKPQLRLSTSGGKLFVDGGPVEAQSLHVTALVKQLSERQIAGFVIQRGVQPDELLGMLRLLILKPAKLEEQGGIAAAMAALGLRHITPSQTTYREVREGEEATAPSQEPPVPPEPTLSAAAVQDLTSALQRWQDALGAPLREARLAGESADLSFLGPLAEGLGWGAGYPTEPQAGGLRDALFAMPGEDQLAFLAALETLPHAPEGLRLAAHGMAPEILGKAVAGLLGAGAPWEELRDPLARALRASPQPQAWARGIDPGLLAAGGEAARIQDLLRQLDWDPQPLDEKLRRALGEGALWALTLEQRLAFLRDLLDQGLHEPFLRVLEQVLRHLTFERPTDREAAALTAAGVSRWLREPGLPHEAEGHLLEALVAHFGWEPLAPIQKATTQALGAFLGAFALRGELQLALGILQDLEGLCSFLEEQQAWRQEALAQLRGALAQPEALNGALEWLHRKGSEVILSEVLPFFEALGEPAATHLVQALGEEPDRKRRGNLLDLIRGLGPTAIPALREALLSPTWYLVRNTLNLLAEIGDADLLPEAAACLAHGDGRVRRSAVRALWKMGGPGSAPFLCKLLPRTDPDTQVEILFGLGQVRSPEAVPALGDLARQASAPEPIRARAAETLGLTGHPSALPILADLLKRKGRIFTSAEPASVRLAAAKALTALGSPEALSTLQAAAAEEPRGPERDALMSMLAARP